MKQIFIAICILFTISFASAQQTRNVGDIIMVNGEFGVVFAITTDGQHGKALCVTQSKCGWSNAKSWCLQIGNNWKLPTKDELRIIYHRKDILNASLKSAGYYTIQDGNYWCLNSRGEVIESPLAVGYGGTVGNDPRIGTCMVCAVSIF